MLLGTTPSATPSSGNVGLPPFSVPPQVPKKRATGEPPLTPAASVDGSEQGASGYFSAANGGSSSSTSVPASGHSAHGKVGEGESVEGKRDAAQVQEPPKKRRRVALTRVGDLGQ